MTSEALINLKDVYVTWNTGGPVYVRRRTGQMMNVLDYWVYYSGYSEIDAFRCMMADAIKIMVRDDCPPSEVHAEFCRIREYVMVMPYDCGGSDEE